MDFLKKIKEIPTVSVRELENQIQQEFTQKRKQYIKIKSMQSQIDVTQPFYYFNKKKLPIVDQEKCFACKNPHSLLQKKHEYLKKKNYKIETQPTSRSYEKQKIFSKNKIFSKEKIRKSDRENIYETEIKRKVRDGFETLEVQTIQKFFRRFKMSCFTDKVKKLVENYCLQKYKSEKVLKNVHLELSSILFEKKFINLLNLEFPMKKQVTFQRNSKNSENFMENIDAVNSFSEKVYMLIKKGRQAIESDQETFSKFANEKLQKFKQNSKELVSLLSNEMDKKNFKDLEKNFNHAMSIVEELIKGKDDEKERTEMIHLTKTNWKTKYQKPKKFSILPNQKDFEMLKLKKNSLKSFKSAISMRQSENEDELQNHSKNESSSSYHIELSQNILSSIKTVEQNKSENEEQFPSIRKNKTSKDFQFAGQFYDKKGPLKMKQRSSDTDIRDFQFNIKIKNRDEGKTNVLEDGSRIKRKTIAPQNAKMRKKTIFAGGVKMPNQLKLRKLQRKMKANQYLNKHREFINVMQNSLKNLQFEPFIINKIDSVLTKKKKIRILRQIVRKVNLRQELSNKLCNEILQYLEIYENSCRLMMGNTKINICQQPDQNFQFNFKKGIYNLDLKFIDLNNDYFYGEADGDGFNVYTGDDPDYPERKKFFFDLHESEEDEKNIQPKQESDLIQVGLPAVSPLEIIENYRSQKKRSTLPAKPSKTQRPLKNSEFQNRQKSKVNLKLNLERLMNCRNKKKIEGK